MFNRCNDMSDAETCLAPLHLLIQGNVSEDAVYCEYWTNHANCLAPITSLIIVNIVNVLNILNIVNILYVVNIGQTMPTITTPIPQPHHLTSITFPQFQFHLGFQIV